MKTEKTNEHAKKADAIMFGIVCIAFLYSIGLAYVFDTWGKRSSSEA